MRSTMNDSWLLERIASHGSKPFLACDSSASTYSDLLQKIEKVGECLRATVGRGDTVAITGDYTLSTIATLLWLYGNGNIVVPVALNAVQDREDRLREGLCDYTVRCDYDDGTISVERVGYGDKEHGLLDKIRSVGHSGLILFSSGSAGKPKAMVHDLTRLINSYRERKPRALTILIFLMFDHIGGVNTLLTSVASGSFIVAPRTRVAEEIAGLIERHRVVILPTSPTFLNLLLISNAQRQYDLSSLKVITYGTEPMPASLLAKLRVEMPRVRFLQTFGTSETGISRSESKSSGSLFMKLEDPEIEHKVVDGELWLRSQTQILGYLNHSMDRFTDDGWFKTGDKVEVDEDGYVRVIGRTSELINVGGEKVTPTEVESVILEIAGVVDCLVSGEPSAITGQMVTVKVLATQDADRSSLRTEIRRHCVGRLQRYKVPAKIEFVEESLFGDRFKKKRN